MQRIALVISYHGKAYHGWQRQPDRPAVQNALEKAIHALSGEWVDVVCAGRTDKGVHALGQVVHFDIDKVREPFVWQNALNAHLPRDIRIKHVEVVPNDFHARFSAKARRYLYYVSNQTVQSPLISGIVAWHPFALDCKAMQAAARHLIGEHDFSAFRGPHCQAHSPIRTVHHLQIQQKNDLFVFDVKANAFLHHMVRNLVGSLLAVGQGKQKPDWIPAVLASKDRQQAGFMAPAEGLYFLEVDYPEGYLLEENRKLQAADTLTNTLAIGCF